MIRIAKPLDERIYDPDLGAGASSTEVVLKYLEQYDKNLFISFTRLDKLGINPQSRYNTPIGLYSYPVSSYERNLKISTKDKAGSAVPFAGDSPFVNIFTAQNPENVVWDIGNESSYSEEALRQDTNRLYKEWVSRYKEDDDKEFYFHEIEIGFIHNDGMDRSKTELEHQKEQIMSLLIEELDLSGIIVQELLKQAHVHPAFPGYRVRSRSYLGDLGKLPKEIEVVDKFPSENGYNLQADLSDSVIDYMNDELESVAIRSVHFNIEVYEAMGEMFSSPDALIEKAGTEARHPSPGGRFWYITKSIAELVAEKDNRKASVVWNKLFRSLGYEGVVDASGSAIIHPSEATQAVFFSRNYIELIDRIENVQSSFTGYEWLVRLTIEEPFETWISKAEEYIDPVASDVYVETNIQYMGNLAAIDVLGAYMNDVRERLKQAGFNPEIYMNTPISRFHLKGVAPPEVYSLMVGYITDTSYWSEPGTHEALYEIIRNKLSDRKYSGSVPLDRVPAVAREVQDAEVFDDLSE